MRDRQFSLRRATEADLNSITRLFQDTILSVSAKDYTPEQVRVWVSVGNSTEKWQKRIREQYFLLAEIEGKLVGFASVSPSGYFDMLYVHKDYQKKGVARTLWNALEGYCRRKKISEVYTDASITARLFFEKQGFELEVEQKKYLDGVEFTNYQMSKRL